MSRADPLAAPPGGLAPCTATWLALLALSCAGWWLGAMRPGRGLLALALAGTLLKAQLLVDHFMGLRHVRLRWRLLLAGWLLLVAALIGAPLWLA